MPLPPPVAEGTAMLPAGTYAGKVVAITGGGTGLGKAFGLEFARLGATIAILSRKVDRVEAAAKTLIDRLSPGQYYKPLGGGWTRK